MSESKKSKWLDEVRAGIEEPITRENLDQYRGILALDFLKGDERTEIEDLLISKLAENDGRAADALADGKVTRAIPALKDRLRAGVPGVMRLAAARALQKLGDTSGIEAVQDVAKSGSDPHERLSAVSALGTWGGEAEQALESSLADDNSSVRSAATKQWIELHGLGAFKRTYRDRLGLLQNRVASPLASVRQQAIDELRDIFARSKAGETPEQLGLTWQADEGQEPLRSFAESLRSKAPPWEHDYAIAGVEALDAAARRWVEDCLWHTLPTDPRAARALASLHVQRALAPLREALPLANGETAKAIEEAIATLG